MVYIRSKIQYDLLFRNYSFPMLSADMYDGIQQLHVKWAHSARAIKLH